MRNSAAKPIWNGSADYEPQLFHRTDSFRFLEQGGRIGVTHIRCGQMVQARVRSTGHDITLEEPERLTVLFPWAGRISCAVGDNMIGMEAGGVLAFGPNRRRTVVKRPPGDSPFQADVLTLPLVTIHEILRKEGLLPKHILPRHDLVTAGMTRIRSEIGMILTCSEAGRPRLEPEIAFDDLTVNLALAMTEEERPAASAGRQRVARAIDMMKARHTDPMSIMALAQYLGCSRRSLQVAFREAGLASPQDVLAGIRLDAARVRLLSGGQNVTESALDSGITHLGRFARAYRNRFGETPADTLSRHG